MKKNVFLVIFLFLLLGFLWAQDASLFLDEQPIRTREPETQQAEQTVKTVPAPEQTQTDRTTFPLVPRDREQNIDTAVNRFLLPLLGYDRHGEIIEPEPQATQRPPQRQTQRPAQRRTPPSTQVVRDPVPQKETKPEPKSAFPVIINPGAKNQNPEIVWNRLLTARELFEWGRGMGLFLLPDSEPIVNNIAGSIPRYGLKIPIEGFEMNKYYRVHIDFVKWRNPSIESFPHRLRIFCDAGSGYRLLADIGIEDISTEGTFFVDLPIDMTVKGKVSLMLRDLAVPRGGGYWAIWDIIVAERGESPENLPEDRIFGDDLPIRNYILN